MTGILCIHSLSPSMIPHSILCSPLICLLESISQISYLYVTSCLNARHSITDHVYALAIGWVFNQFSAGNCSRIANKKMMKCTSAPANVMLVAGINSSYFIQFHSHRNRFIFNPFIIFFNSF